MSTSVFRRLVGWGLLTVSASMWTACATDEVQSGNSTATSCISNFGCPNGFSCVQGSCQLGGSASATTTQSTPPAPVVATSECTPCADDSVCQALSASSFCRLADTAGTVGYCGLDCTSVDATCPSGTVCSTDSNDPFSSCVPSPAGACAVAGASGPSQASGASGATGPSGPSGPSGASGATGPTGPTCTDTWTNWGSAFFSTTCSGCHSFVSSYASFQPKFTLAQTKIDAGQMPLDPSTFSPAPLSAADVARIDAWFKCGAPQ